MNSNKALYSKLLTFEREDKVRSLDMTSMYDSALDAIKSEKQWEAPVYKTHIDEFRIKKGKKKIVSKIDSKNSSQVNSSNQSPRKQRTKSIIDQIGIKVSLFRSTF